MNRTKKWFVISFIILTTVLAFGISKIYTDVKNTADQIYVPLKETTTSKRVKAVQTTLKEPFSVLVLGVDERAEDSGRSDTMIVLTVNASKQSTKMISIPRDSYTEIVGKGFHDKINHAFAYGGKEMAKETVEQLFHIPIDYIVQINMNSFVELVNIMDGITVHNTIDFHVDGEHFPIGDIQLDGDRALQYVRMRYDDPNGDFGRQARQKQVIEQLILKALSIKSLLQYEKIFKQIEKNVQVNATFLKLLNIQKNYAKSFKDIEQLSFQQPGNMVKDGIYYYKIDEQELANIQQSLRQHLQLHTTD